MSLAHGKKLIVSPFTGCTLCHHKHCHPSNEATLPNKLSEYKQYQCTYHVPATKLHIIENHRIESFAFILSSVFSTRDDRKHICDIIHSPQYTLISFIYLQCFLFFIVGFHSHFLFFSFFFFNFLTFSLVNCSSSMLSIIIHTVLCRTSIKLCNFVK